MAKESVRLAVIIAVTLFSDTILKLAINFQDIMLHFVPFKVQTAQYTISGVLAT